MVAIILIIILALVVYGYERALNRTADKATRLFASKFFIFDAKSMTWMYNGVEKIRNVDFQEIIEGISKRSIKGG